MANDASTLGAGASITIAIATFRRPDSLRQCLSSIQRSATTSEGDRLLEVLVVDNDPEHSAQQTVEDWTDQRHESMSLRYVVEPTPGVTAVRNRALAEAEGDVLVFIDDDETVTAMWPAGLVDEMRRSGAALVGGPVRNHFAVAPPAWLVKGRFLERAEPPTGTPHDWLRTGNLAVHLEPVRSAGLRFDDAFGRSGAEDVAFSSAARRAGLALSWSAVAVVTETVPPERTSVEWIVDRERRATSGYVRARVAADGLRAMLPRAVRTILLRLPQGVLLVVAGRALGQKHLSVKGTATIGRVFGTMEGLLDRRYDEPYGHSSPQGRGPTPDRA